MTSADIIARTAIAEVAVDEGALFGVRGYALDPDRAKALWALSEQMVGERF
jgi:hypothetical protein